MDRWEYIKQFYKAHFGIDSWVVELMANKDILLLCASGAANETISIFLEIPLDEIELVIKEAFDFPGWTQDLSCNPYKIYNENPREFEANIRNFYPEDKDIIVSICKAMELIEERLYDEWI